MKSKNIITNFEIETEFISEHLINCKDIDNLIIKGHLIIEYCLNKFINKQSFSIIDISKSRFSFIEKVEICKILGLFELNKNLYQNVILLNKLRNSIAHNLKFDKSTFNKFLTSADLKSLTLNKYLETFDLVVKNENNEVYNIELKHIKFMVCISSIYGKIHTYIDLLLDNQLRFKKGIKSIPKNAKKKGNTSIAENYSAK